MNDHIFTFISPYGVVVDIQGYVFNQLADGSKTIQYQILNQDKEHVATIPGDWIFVRLSEQYEVHS